ncbi:A24 family peptidase [Streptococcus pyogenes]|uniref:prepilin peptidase n=1 Tax=Streptococcus pyogenes TaxID=1314 RepID=UPI00132FA557|nr:prepilin peptidase [Streptococcus pyogenes]
MIAFFSICSGILLTHLFYCLLLYFPDNGQEQLSKQTVIVGLIIILWASMVHWVSASYCYLLLFSLLFSLFDWRSQEYPFILWLFSFVSLLLFYSINYLSLILLLLGLLAHLRPFSIGAGDFFYLASLALVLDLTSLIWLIQLASLAGITACLLLGIKRIPFIPYLSFGLFWIVLLEHF